VFGGGANFNGWEGLALPSPLVLAPAGPIASDTPVSKQMTSIQPDLDIRQTTTRQPTAVAPSGSGPVSAAAGGALPSSGAAAPARAVAGRHLQRPRRLPLLVLHIIEKIQYCICNVNLLRHVDITFGELNTKTCIGSGALIIHNFVGLVS